MSLIRKALKLALLIFFRQLQKLIEASNISADHSEHLFLGYEPFKHKIVRKKTSRKFSPRNEAFIAEHYI
jgi:hypothetical protein